MTDAGGYRRPASLLLAMSIVCALASSRTASGTTKPTFVQRQYLRVTTGNSISVTFRRATKAGNTIIAYVVWDNAGAVSLADSSGHGYTSAAGPTVSTDGGTSAQIFYAPNVSGGRDTVTATFAQPIAAKAMLFVHEYSGLDQLAPLDAAVVATGLSSQMDSGALAVAQPNELLFAGGASNSRAITRLSRGFRARARRYGNVTATRLVAAAGAYNITAAQHGTAWIFQLVAFKPTGSTPPSTAYPLKVSANGRYLIDQNGRPVLLTGDSPQALMVNLTEAEADAFFADRQANAFNVVWINLLCATYTGGRADGSTYDGIVPFSTPFNLSTPNEAYFARVDHMLQLAAQHGLTVLLDPAETGSFLSVLSANGATAARNYGRYLGTRYRSFDNIIWMSGNDFQTWQNSADDDGVLAVALGIRDSDDRHIQTIELDYLVSGSLDDPSW